MKKEIVKNLINKLIDEGKLPFSKDDFFFEESELCYFLVVNGIDSGVDINSDGDIIFDRCTPDERIVSEENLEQELINQLEHLTSDYSLDYLDNGNEDDSDYNDNGFSINVDVFSSVSEETKNALHQKAKELKEYLQNWIESSNFKEEVALSVDIIDDQHIELE